MVEVREDVCMSEPNCFPRSCRDEIDGIPYFPRMCEKIGLHGRGELDQDYHPNLGRGLDLWTCEFLEVDYEDLKRVVLEGADDRAALNWAYEAGRKPEDPMKGWWCSYVRNRGFRDDLSERLFERKREAGFGDRDDICTFFDFIDAEEGHDRE